MRVALRVFCRQNAGSRADRPLVVPVPAANRMVAWIILTENFD